MIVCLCDAASETTICLAAKRGLCTLEKLMEACIAGSGCGGCHEQINELLNSLDKPAERVIAARIEGVSNDYIVVE